MFSFKKCLLEQINHTKQPERIQKEYHYQKDPCFLLWSFSWTQLLCLVRASKTELQVSLSFGWYCCPKLYQNCKAIYYQYLFKNVMSLIQTLWPLFEACMNHVVRSSARSINLVGQQLCTVWQNLESSFLFEE